MSGFAAKAGAAPIEITIGDGETSLAQIRDKINAAGAGVTASIVNDASGARLSIISRETGAANGFKIAAHRRALRPRLRPARRIGPGAEPGGAQCQRTINGIEVSSASNTLSNVVEGITLNLLAPTTTPASVSVASNTDAVKAAVDSFVKAFNGLASYIRTQTKYDAASKTGGPLQGDRTAIGLQNQLRNVLNEGSSASSVYTRLSDIGLVMKADGTLETKSSKLTEALSSPANLAELRKLFATETEDDATSGFMVRYRKLAARVLGTDGSLTTAHRRPEQPHPRPEEARGRAGGAARRHRGAAACAVPGAGRADGARSAACRATSARSSACWGDVRERPTKSAAEIAALFASQVAAVAFR